jgi:hypothetical protein
MSYAIGENLPISWSVEDWLDPDGNDLSVKIELSRNGGTDWETIDAGAPNTGSYDWEVTGPAAASCLIRLSDPDDSSVNDVGAAFEITGATGGGPVIPVFMNQYRQRRN